MSTSTFLMFIMGWRALQNFSVHTTTLGKQHMTDFLDTYIATLTIDKTHCMILLLWLDSDHNTAIKTIPHGIYWLEGYKTTSPLPKRIMGWKDSLNVTMRITNLGKKWLAGQLGSNINTPAIKQPNITTSSSWMLASQISTINVFHWGGYNWLKLGPPQH